jgi:nitrogen fixation protein FixH
MRVRPFFWVLLALSCSGVLIFAATLRTHAPAIMQVRLDQRPPVVGGVTTLELHLTDSQGLPIEQAQVLPNARMTNMDMVTNQIRVESLGQGNYMAQFQLYMAGPWVISIEAHADGFESLERTLLVQV